MSKIQSHFLSLIIPTYNKEKTIVDNIRGIQAVLENIRYDYEMLVVVDGQVDNTLQVLKKAKISKLLMFIDSGFEIDPNGISMLLEHMEWYEADIIVGSKRHAASQVNYSLLRRILSLGYYWLVKILFQVNVKDTQAGIKIFKKTVLQRLLPRLVEKKFAGDLEMLVAAKQLGYKRIYEAPIKLDYTFASVTDAATLKSIYGILYDTLSIFYRTYILQYYKKRSRKD